MERYSININGKKEIIKEETKEVNCANNQITELILPDSVKRVNCANNQITELILPNSVKWVYCNKTVDIKNLDKFIGKDDVNIIFM